MRLCVITDEISQDLVHALDVCEDEGVNTVELRAVNGANTVSHDHDSVEEIKATIEGRGFRVGAIASPFLKCHLHGNGDPKGGYSLRSPRLKGGAVGDPRAFPRTRTLLTEEELALLPESVDELLGPAYGRQLRAIFEALREGPPYRARRRAWPSRSSSASTAPHARVNECPCGPFLREGSRWSGG